MKNTKLTIVLLTILLVVLVIVFTLVYFKLYAVKEPEVTQQEELQDAAQDIDADEPDDVSDSNTSEYVSSPEDIVLDGDNSADTKLALNTIHSDNWNTINKYLGDKFTADDVTYVGYDQSVDGLYFYKLNNSDVSIATIITDEYIGVERFTNTIDTAYGTVYFDNGIPSNSRDIYAKIPNDQLYETDYVGGNTVQYWPITDKNDVKEVSL